MGADIIMFVEHKDTKTNRWDLVRNSNWQDDIVPIDRNSALFHILCGYNKKDFTELHIICECKGLPSDVDKEAEAWLEDLSYVSYLSLEEILNFRWDENVCYFEEECKYSEIAGSFFNKIIPYLCSLDTNYQNVRIVFGLSF